MKKSLLTLLGAGLLLTSCQSDEPFAPGECGEKQVTFTLNVPGELGTRAAAGEKESDKGGFSNGQGRLYYTLVLDANGDTQILKNATISNDGKTATFTPTVVLGRDYTITAYASFEDNSLIDERADVEAIAVSKNFNDESKDAYFHTITHNFAEDELEPLTLKRPFGKLRLLATDYNVTDNAKPITDVKSVTVEYTSEIPNQFDAVDGIFDNYATVASYTYNWTVDGSNYVNYYKMTDGAMPLFADYIPANGEGQDNPTTFKVTVTYGNGETYSRTFNDIPVRRNALTTLKGNFFTAGAEIKVEVKDAFEGQPENINFVSVSTATQLQEAINEGGNGETIILTDDINLNDLFGPNFAPTRAGNNDPSITIAAEKNLTIDLNGKKLSAISKQTGKNYNMIDVHGELTVKNGTIEYKHEGDDMEWNNYAEIFHVDFGGTLNLEGVTANNRGGSAMAYVIDMTNGTDITVNVKNSTLQSTYIPVRVFNNNKNGVHNVAISNTTLKGKYCFWVQYWLADDRDQETLKRTLKLDIFDGTNTFEYTNDDETPVLCGFNEYLELDEDGYGTFGTSKKTHYVYSANALIKLSKNGLNAGDTVLLCADIDLAGKDFNGLDTFHPENGTTFDGQRYTVSNWTNESGASDMGFIRNWVGTIKNINFKNCRLKTSGRSAIVAAKVYGNIENVHVEDCSIEDSYWACGLIAGLYNAGSISDCSATNSSVKSNGGTAAIAGVVNESAGTRSFTNCKVEGCTINNTGAYGEAYSGAAIAGIINVSNSTIKFIGCQQINNTFEGKHIYEAFHAPTGDGNTIVIE